MLVENFSLSRNTIVVVFVLCWHGVIIISMDRGHDHPLSWKNDLRKGSRQDHNYPS